MKLESIEEYLQALNPDEIFYRQYYLAKRHEKEYATYIQSLNPEFIRQNNLIVPEIAYSFQPEQFGDESFFCIDSPQCIFLKKHDRYTPEFLHSHIFFEVIYVLKGTCRQSIQGQQVFMETGDVCLLSPGVKHTIACFDDDSLIINILIRRSTFKEVFFSFLRNDNILSSFFLTSLYTKHICEYIVFHTGYDLEIKRNLLEMYIEQLENKRYSERILNNMLMIYFAKILRGYEHNIILPAAVNKENIRGLAFIYYMKQHYKDITLEDMAREFHFTAPYTSAYIKKVTGYTYTQILQKLRLEHAESLLKNTNVSISRISEEIGYLNPEHFIRLFKRSYGISPNCFRQKWGNCQEDLLSAVSLTPK
ncbi:transcription regulator hth arac- type [Lucifera butyrica]|uniref:Transcription regulator hth arac- type n=1 Tax=Lucifera butyrica TaxID=1351585 RepID=A0A498RDB7_9FIRM|nr:AraC family transcriptional regulator [Lucifera butyrica]VBB07188.1 transcription regulator hth arac- type [Lucifera butyrica]